MKAKVAFGYDIPEIFDSITEAQAAIDNNPLPFPAMKYKINEGIYSKNGYTSNLFTVGSLGVDGNWMGFLNTALFKKDIH